MAEQEETRFELWRYRRIPNDPWKLETRFGGNEEDVERLETVPAARVQELEGTLDQLLEAVRYVREPHHLNHANECSLCHVATDMLDGATDRARAALTHSTPPSDD